MAHHLYAVLALTCIAGSFGFAPFSAAPMLKNSAAQGVSASFRPISAATYGKSARRIHRSAAVMMAYGMDNKPKVKNRTPVCPWTVVPSFLPTWTNPQYPFAESVCMCKYLMACSRLFSLMFVDFCLYQASKELVQVRFAKPDPDGLKAFIQ
jgi:hypothetical protein